MGLTLAAGALTPQNITVLFLAIAVLLGTARLFGEIARRFKQPSVLGEILAGIVLGPTLLGAIAPDVYSYLFPEYLKVAGEIVMQGGEKVYHPTYIAMQGLIIISAALLLLVAGLEVDLSMVVQQGKNALLVSAAGISGPFMLGFSVAWFAPDWLGYEPPVELLPFALFCGVAMSITALPVIAKILIDLNMSKSDMGTLIMSSAMINDLVGWIIFAIILAMMAQSPGIDPDAVASNGQGTGAVVKTVIFTLAFLALMVTLGRLVFHRLLPWVQAYTSWPGGPLVLVLVVGLLCAAFTEFIGVHSIFGAFIAGVAIGDSSHLRQRTRDVIYQFIMNCFAPLFFASIGLRLSFIESFDLLMVPLVLGIALVGKVGGCFLGAKLSGMDNRSSGAVGFGMAAQGALGIILGELALQAGLIGEKLFVAIVIMALATSLISGPMIQTLLKRKARLRLSDLLGEKQFILRLEAGNVRQAIAEMAGRAAQLTALDFQAIDEAVWAREQIVHTGLEHGLAVPHARLEGLKKPLVLIGRSEAGIDFDAADGEPARIICMLLSPADSPSSQLELLDAVARAFLRDDTRAAAVNARSYTEFLAALNLGETEQEEAEAEEATKE